MADRVNLVKALGPQLLVHSAEGAVRSAPTAEALAGKVVLVYFSAHWCPPCRQFTPRLAATYRLLRDAGREVECVFVSSDRSEAQFQEYFAPMPWAALPFSNRAAATGLSSIFKVQGIPRLVVIGAGGEVLSGDAREAVLADAEGQRFPWEGAVGSAAGGAASLGSLRMLLLFLLFWWLSKYLTSGG